MTIFLPLRHHLRSVRFPVNVKHEARLTGSARSMQEKGWNCGESVDFGAGQPLLSMRLLSVVSELGRTQDLLHFSSLGQLVDQFVEIPALLHKWIFDLFYSVATNDARNEVRIGV